MKEVFKYIVLTLVVVLIGGYLLAAAIWFSTRPKEQVCSNVEWVIEDLTEREYVTPEELDALLKRTNLYPEGKKINQVLSQAIEACVTSHPMVRQAQCYITTKGKVKVCLTQRVPVVGIDGEKGKYYVDTDRLRMPANERITTPVPWAKGKVREEFAKTTLVDIVEWIEGHRYWSHRFDHLEVSENQEVALIDTAGLSILVGKGCDLDKKMGKLRVFEEQMRKVGGKEYKELDLRYKDQVIGRK